ncbi:hypothetical protein [Pararhizobium gei]|uniref:hypothetical protein n=1 Tax=Pararhizobium gei TaxID=1395951 RepID=UPI0023DC1EBB|nr:hypothetical protein [Rhizobium gei]
MAQRFDILVGQQFGQFVAPVDRQDAGNGVEFVGAAIDGGLGNGRLGRRETPDRRLLTAERPWIYRILSDLRLQINYHR